MKNIKDYILESKTSKYGNIKFVEKIFEPYNIKITWLDESTASNEYVYSAKYNDGKNKDDRRRFFSILINNDGLFFIKAVNYYPTVVNEYQTYNFINDKWEKLDKRNNKPQTKLDDLSKAFTGENLKEFLNFLDKYNEFLNERYKEIHDKQNKESSNEIEKIKKNREKKIIPKIISLLNKYINEDGISYNDLIKKIENYEDISQKNINKIKNFLKSYKSNTFIEVGDSREIDGLYDMVIFDGWDEDTDENTIDVLGVGEENFVSLHKYDKYILFNLALDLDLSYLYLIK